MKYTVPATAVFEQYPTEATRGRYYTAPAVDTRTRSAIARVLVVLGMPQRTPVLPAYSNGIADSDAHMSRRLAACTGNDRITSCLRAW